MNNITGIQRRRRMLAEQEAIAAAKAAEEENEGEAIDPPTVDDLKLFTPEMVDAMTIEDVKEVLEAHNIKFAHNAGEENLKGKLKDAIAGA